ncbi:MAG: hypothetical protein KGH53_03785 [Candidatus Micrarchaeota archaeon]|nr:hypothetical protein [Candidatus Micrarchaeota archaeon]
MKRIVNLKKFALSFLIREVVYFSFLAFGVFVLSLSFLRPYRFLLFDARYVGYSLIIALLSGLTLVYAYEWIDKTRPKNKHLKRLFRILR